MMDSANIKIANEYRKVNALGTSAGPTSEELASRLRAMVGEGNGKNILKVGDGSSPYKKSDKPWALSRLFDKAVEDPTAKWWTNYYIKHVLGDSAAANMQTVTVADEDPYILRQKMEAADLILVPGGNTYKTMRGINERRENRQTFLEMVLAGKPYMGESAGAIILGRSLVPASISPADRLPNLRAQNETTLDIVDADVIVHANGTKGGFDSIGGLGASVTGITLDWVASPKKGEVERYTKNLAHDGIPYSVSNNKEGFSIFDGTFIPHLQEVEQPAKLAQAA